MPTFTWQITAGGLPAGLSMAPSGLITGTPMAAIANLSVTVTVTDGSCIRHRDVQLEDPFAAHRREPGGPGRHGRRRGHRAARLRHRWQRIAVHLVRPGRHPAAGAQPGHRQQPGPDHRHPDDGRHLSGAAHREGRRERPLDHDQLHLDGQLPGAGRDEPRCPDQHGQHRHHRAPAQRQRRLGVLQLERRRQPAHRPDDDDRRPDHRHALGDRDLAGLTHAHRHRHRQHPPSGVQLDVRRCRRSPTR